MLSVLDEQIEATRRAIREHINGSPTLRGQRDLLTSLPGIADTTAAALLAELLDAKQFAGARQAAAFAGLVPRVRQSGTSVRGRASLSKVGSARLRKALFYPAMVALRFNPVLMALHTRLSAAGKSKKLIVGAAMRKLLHLAVGVLRSGRPFDPGYCSNLGRKTATSQPAGA